jgi:hypothetical protein
MTRTNATGNQSFTETEKAMALGAGVQHGGSHASKQGVVGVYGRGVLVDPATIGHDPVQVAARRVSVTQAHIRPIASAQIRVGAPTGRVNHPRRAVVTLVTALIGLFGVLAVGSEVAAAKPGPTTRSPRYLAITADYGDSLWSIARAVHPTGDVRPVVREMVRLHGSQSVRAGDTVRVPLDA